MTGTEEATKLVSLEQHGRMQNLENAGVKVTNGKDTNLIVIKTTELRNVKITLEIFQRLIAYKE